MTTINFFSLKFLEGNDKSKETIESITVFKFIKSKLFKLDKNNYSYIKYKIFLLN